MNPGIVTVPLAVEHLGPDPARARRNADTLLPNNSAHRVTAVTVTVHRVERAVVGGVVPTVGVVGRAMGVIAPVVGPQRGVEPVHARIHPRHNNSRARDIERGPNLVGADAHNSPFGGGWRLNIGHWSFGSDPLAVVIEVNGGDFRSICQGKDGVPVSVDSDLVDDPERGVGLNPSGGPRSFQVGAQQGLGAVRRVLQRRDEARAGLACVQRPCGCQLEVYLLAQANDDTKGIVGAGRQQVSQ